MQNCFLSIFFVPIHGNDISSWSSYRSGYNLFSAHKILFAKLRAFRSNECFDYEKFNIIIDENGQHPLYFESVVCLSMDRIQMKQTVEATQSGHPQAFVCTFCKQEFEQISSVFSHMKEVHDSKHILDE